MKTNKKKNASPASFEGKAVQMYLVAVCSSGGVLSTVTIFQADITNLLESVLRAAINDSLAYRWYGVQLPEQPFNSLFYFVLAVVEKFISQWQHRLHQHLLVLHVVEQVYELVNQSWFEAYVAIVLYH